MVKSTGNLSNKADPARCCLKLRDWPEADQIAWAAAATQGTLPSENGLASQWGKKTQKAVQDGYGRWLTFLQRKGWCDPKASPGQRLTHERLDFYIAELQATVAPATVSQRITNLAEALRVMELGFDLRYLRQARARLKALTKPLRLPNPNKDPSRHCLKLDNWPVADQRAWEAALVDGGLIEDSGLAAHWRPATRKSVLDAYGRYLTFLERTDSLDPNSAPGQRLTPDRLRAYTAELKGTVAPSTARNRVRDLAEALRVMAPENDFLYLQRARARLKALAPPVRNKRAKMLASRDLFQLGLELTKRAERDDVDDVISAALYRDGLIIMMLTCRPIRRRSFAELRLGVHLVLRGAAYVIILQESETKNHRRYEQALPAFLTPFIKRYLDHDRPRLLRGAQVDRVWISRSGRAMPDTGLYAAVRSRTKAAFGIGIPPHRFRDIAVTSMGEIDPELVCLAPTLLHHADRRIAEMHYNLARDASAVGLWQDYVLAERRAASYNHRSARLR